MRINGITVHGEIYPGQFFLVRVVNENNGGAESMHLYEHPARTNQSHEECIDGWLGTTNNVARYAEGAVEVSGDIGKNGRDAYRVKRINAEALWAEDNHQV